MAEEGIQVESPLSLKPVGDLRPPNGHRYLLIALLILIPAFIFLISLALFFMGPTPEDAYQYGIGRFAGVVEYYSHKNHSWSKVTRAEQKQIILQAGDKVKTQKGADLDLAIPKVMDLRVKPSSEVHLLRSTRGTHGDKIRLKLSRGSLLGSSGEQFKGRELEIETPVLVAAVRGTAFLVQANPYGTSSVSVLKGMVDVYSRRSKRTVTVNALEIVVADPKERTPLKPKRVSYQEWRALNEVHDFTAISTVQAAEQVDLRAGAGSLFKYVFDEGVFYKPNWGFANREYYKEKETGAVILRIDYDVFPQGSFSGVYFKTRDLDLSKVHRLSFSLKADSEKPVPQQFRIEFKDKFSIVRGFAVKSITRDWRLYSFDFNAQIPTPVSEIVFVFENSKAGAMSASSTVYLKDLTIE